MIVKIFLAQQNYHIGNFESNAEKLISAVREAKQGGGDLIVFPELAVCGYPPRDFLEFSDFIDQSLAVIERLRNEAEGIAILVGAPARNPKPEGKDLFNAAYFIADRKIQSVVHKTLLPTYDVFDEYRYFEPANQWEVVQFRGIKIAVTICEDIWNLQDNPLYPFSPMERLASQQPDLIINLSASPFDYLQSEERGAIIMANLAQYRVPLVYCNTVGAQTDIIFDGGSVVVDASGEVVMQLPYFQEALKSVDLELKSVSDFQLGRRNEEQEIIYDASRNIESIYEALLVGIRDYFNKMGFRKAVVASSGGIDSAVVLALATEALGAENVQAILMPSPYSSSHSVEDAKQLSENLKNPYELIRIDAIFQSYLDTLQPTFRDLPVDVTEENLQSRIRGAIAMAWANKFGAILLNTSNKSELATGYGTLYGDMAGGLSVIGDLYKTQVYALARHINRNQVIIPDNILTKAPSAELRPGQKDSDSLPEYEIMDPILFEYIEKCRGAQQIETKGFDLPVVNRILAMVNKNEYKRNQFCPILRVSPKAFGSGRRLPVVGRYLW